MINNNAEKDKQTDMGERGALDVVVKDIIRNNLILLCTIYEYNKETSQVKRKFWKKNNIPNTKYLYRKQTLWKRPSL